MAMKIKIIAYYSIFLGFSVIGLWSVILKSGSLEEGKIELSFHLFSELLMATLCILSGFKLLFRHKRAIPINILANGMIIYSVINAAGYYGERGEIIFLIMFMALVIISALIIVTHLKESFQP
jgi:hypothetical protein